MRTIYVFNEPSKWHAIMAEPIVAIGFNALVVGTVLWLVYVTMRQDLQRGVDE